MRSRIALACLIMLTVAFADAAVAHADATPAQDAMALGIARAAWPASSCLGHETITYTDDLTAEEGALHEELNGFALVDQCAVVVRASLAPYMRCVVLTHELGHLAGMQHTDNGSVMDPDAGDGYAPCRRVLGTIREQVMTMAHDAFGQFAACTPWKRDTRRCRTVKGTRIFMDARAMSVETI